MSKHLARILTAASMVLFLGAISGENRLSAEEADTAAEPAVDPAKKKQADGLITMLAAKIPALDKQAEQVIKNADHPEIKAAHEARLATIEALKAHYQARVDAISKDFDPAADKEFQPLEAPLKQQVDEAAARLGYAAQIPALETDLERQQARAAKTEGEGQQAVQTLVTALGEQKAFLAVLARGEAPGGKEAELKLATLRQACDRARYEADYKDQEARVLKDKTKNQSVEVDAAAEALLAQYQAKRDAAIDGVDARTRERIADLASKDAMEAFSQACREADRLAKEAEAAAREAAKAAGQ